MKCYLYIIPLDRGIDIDKLYLNTVKLSCACPLMNISHVDLYIENININNTRAFKQLGRKNEVTKQ